MTEHRTVGKTGLKQAETKRQNSSNNDNKNGERATKQTKKNKQTKNQPNKKGITFGLDSLIVACMCLGGWVFCVNM